MKTLLLRALAVLVLVAAFAAGTVALLVVAFDLQIELAGNGMQPIFSFGDPDDHYAALAASRAIQPPPAAPATAATARRAGGAGTDATATPSVRAATDDRRGETAAPGSGAASTGGDPQAGAGGAGGDDDSESGETLDSGRSGTSSPAAPAAPADAPSSETAGGYWTDFRGPDRDGRYTETPIRTDWPGAGIDPVWSQPIGGGYASFVVAGGLAFTIEQRRDDEVVAAYDVATGIEQWSRAWPGHFRETMGGPGPRATPTWHDGRLYALGAAGRFVCLDAATGAVLWERDILADGGAANLPWAMSGAPLVVDDTVVVLPGGAGGWSVAAYDRLTGEVVWHVLDDVQAYTSPMLATLGGARQIVVVTAERAAGLRPGDGALLWEYPWTVPIVPNMAQPLVVGDARLFLSASYGKGGALIELARPYGRVGSLADAQLSRGKLLAPAGDRFTVTTVWETNRMKNKFSSSVLIDGYIYGLDESILACIDAATGELMWKGGRYGYGQLLAAGDHLVVLTERGDLVLVRATPDGHEEVAGFRAIEGKTWNVPAMAGGRILVRNARQMAAFDLSP